MAARRLTVAEGARKLAAAVVLRDADEVPRAFRRLHVAIAHDDPVTPDDRAGVEDLRAVTATVKESGDWPFWVRLVAAELDVFTALADGPTPRKLPEPAGAAP